MFNRILVRLLLATVAQSTTGCYPTVTLSPDAPRYSPGPVPAKGAGVVYMYRLNVNPTELAPTVLVDGRPIGVLPDGGYTWFTVHDGAHTLKLEWPGWDRLNVEARLKIASETETFVKVSGSYGVGRMLAYREYGVALGAIEKPYAVAEMRRRCGFVAFGVPE